jgi:hypothetical protein
MTTCSICNSDFDQEAEGGISGTIGTFVTVAFCVWCHSGLHDLYDQMRLPVPCQRCGHLYDEDEDDA